VIVPDVNVLVYAFRREADDHTRYAEWMTDVITGPDDLGLIDTVITGFVRIVTNPRIFTDPSPTTTALDFVDSLHQAPRSRMIPPTFAAWAQFRTLCADPLVRGNLVPDAWIAASALAHGGTVATADRGFGRFAGLDWFVPIP
jgi:uncharacterized protein